MNRCKPIHSYCEGFRCAKINGNGGRCEEGLASSATIEYNTVYCYFFRGRNYRDEANHTFILSTRFLYPHLRKSRDNRRLRREDVNTFIELDSFVSKKRLAELSSTSYFFEVFFWD